MIIKYKLFESPDGIDDTGSGFRDNDARTFGYYNGQFYAADHYDIWHGWDPDEREPLVTDKYGEGIETSREDFEYPGRLWLEDKIISFWIYPENREKMRKVIRDLENYYDIEMWNDPEWKIEILTNYETDPEEWDDYEWDMNDNIETDIIRLSDYKSSGKRSEDELRQQHVLSPMDKRKVRPKGWKPKDYKYRLPGETEVEARYRVNKYMYQESIVTDFKLFENPDFVKKYDDLTYHVGYGFLMYKGKLYYEYGKTHYDLIKQPKGASLAKMKDKFAKKMGRYPGSDREVMDYPGRIWLRNEHGELPKNLITFWKYPENRDVLYDIIKQFCEGEGIPFKESQWMIETLTVRTLKKIKKLPEDDLIPNTDTAYQGFLGKKSYRFIPINKFKKSEAVPEEELSTQHVLSPMDKRKDKPQGWKPKGIKYRLPGEPEIVAKRRLKYLYQESKQDYIYVFWELTNGLVMDVNTFYSEEDAKTYIVNAIHEATSRSDEYYQIKNNFDADELLQWYQEEMSIYGKEFHFWRTEPKSNIELNKELALRRETNKFNL